jgi:hypothetical protein
MKGTQRRLADMHNALDNRGVAWLHLDHQTVDNSLLVEAEDKASRAQKVEGKASYNLACVYALQNRDEEFRLQLLRCKANDTLPDVAHVLAEEDLKGYRDQAWFRELLGEV